MKVQLSFKESIAKIEEGIKFFARGIRLFSSDIGNSGRLVVFAATGSARQPLHRIVNRLMQSCFEAGSQAHLQINECPASLI